MTNSGSSFSSTRRHSSSVPRNREACEADLDELRQALSPHALITDIDRTSPYIRDESSVLTPGIPLAVVRAHSTDDVASALHWAHHHHIAVVPRGTGTGLSAGAMAIDGSLVISVAQMNKIIEINDLDFMATVEPGVITADLDRAASEYGLMYAPDPSSCEISSIGGNLATNAGGLRCVKYGVTRNFARQLTVVLADGKVLTTGHQTVKGVTGLDLVDLFVGSEGTLGIITQAVVALVPRPHGDPVTIVADFQSNEDAMNAVNRAMLKKTDPSMMEFIDRYALQALENWKHPGFGGIGALILAQVDGWGARERAQLIAEAFKTSGAGSVAISTTAKESVELFALRRMTHQANERLGHCLGEDICVPRSRLADTMTFINDLSKRYDIVITTVAHAGDGNLHPTFIYQGATAQDIPPQVWKAAGELFRYALKIGGTLTGEHGVGVLKYRWLTEELGSLGMVVNARIKKALDPRGILNPGRAI